MRGTTQTSETAAMLLIGDGVLGVVRPSEHCNVWRTDHDGQWNAILIWFSRRPSLVRAIAAAEIAAGLWLAQRNFAHHWTEERPRMPPTTPKPLDAAQEESLHQERITTAVWGPVL